MSTNGELDTDEKEYDSHLSLSAVQLFGRFELNAGLAYTKYTLANGFEPDPNVDYTEVKSGLALYGNIAFRYSKENFVLRTGIGNLELLFLSLGVNF